MKVNKEFIFGRCNASAHLLNNITCPQSLQVYLLSCLLGVELLCLVFELVVVVVFVCLSDWCSRSLEFRTNTKSQFCRFHFMDLLIDKLI